MQNKLSLQFQNNSRLYNRATQIFRWLMQAQASVSLWEQRSDSRAQDSDLNSQNMGLPFSLQQDSGGSEVGCNKKGE